MLIGRNALSSTKKLSWEHVVENMVDKFYTTVIARAQRGRI
jgi:hypothetical protein